jgi:hypothetical protein
MMLKAASSKRDIGGGANPSPVFVPKFFFFFLKPHFHLCLMQNYRVRVNSINNGGSIVYIVVGCVE